MNAKRGRRVAAIAFVVCVLSVVAAALAFALSPSGPFMSGARPGSTALSPSATAGAEQAAAGATARPAPSGSLSRLFSAAFAPASALSAPVVIGGTRPQTPAVSGGRVVWCDTKYGDPDIFMYDSATRLVTRLTTDRAPQTDPDISGDVVVWSDKRTGKATIRARDLVTGAEFEVSPNIGDQVRPAVSGSWVVWEDYRNSYSPAIYARDLSGGTERRIASAFSSKKRPRIAGDLVVWEDYYATNGAGDVKSYNLVTGVYGDVAVSASSELLPDTDGRYVVWTQAAAGGMNVMALDTMTGARTALWSGRGEQSFPVVSNGVAYWMDNTPGTRLHADTYAFGSGGRGRFDDAGTADIAGLAVDGGSAAWLAKRGTSWQVVARVPASVALTSRLTSLLPRPLLRLLAPKAAASVRAPRVDETARVPLKVVAASVRPGQLGVSASAPITVRFSKALDPSAVNLSHVYLVEEGSGRKVRARVTYDRRRATVVLRPASRLGATAYTLVVDEQVVDSTGGQIDDSTRVSFATIRTLAQPLAPGTVRARVSGVASVTVSWVAVPGAIRYYVYRSTSPTLVLDYTQPSQASCIATVSPGSVTSATVAAASDEASCAYCYNYVVVADNGTALSAQSLNASPDVHGLSSSLVDTCRQCHSSIHGAPTASPYLGAAGAQDCYRCHGNTPGIAAYASNSQYDVQAGFVDDAVVATTGPMRTAGGPGVIHRNAGLVTNGHACDSCHGPHRRPYDTAAATDFDRLLRTQIASVVSTTDPSSAFRYNTLAAPVGNQMCFDCHGSAADNAETLMDIAAGAGSWARAGGDHRTNYANTAHGDTSKVPTPSPDVPSPGIQCVACHDEHGSTVPRLLGEFDPATNTSRMVYGSTVSTLTGNDKSVCYGCHTAPTPSFPAASRTASGYPMQGTWPGKAVWDAAYDPATHTGSFHGTSTVVWGGAGKAGGDCKNCHVIHGADSQNALDVLRRDVAGATTFSPATFAFCFECHGGSGPSADDISRYFPTSAGGKATQGADTRYGHRTLSAGTLPAGSAMPCYDCHNPHGSGSAYGLMLVVRSQGATITIGDAAGEIVMGPSRTASDVRRFCFGCHTTSDTAKGWTGAAMLAVLGGDTVEGISRSTYSATGAHLRLPPATGHKEADAQSCYQCHLADYSSAESNNVHNPTGGISKGGVACYGCHAEYQPMEYDDPARTGSYHHVLGGGAFSSEGDTATQPGGAGTYPTSTTDVYCISCHADHNYFNGSTVTSPAANLRVDIAQPGSLATNTDFIAGGSYAGVSTYGICVSCHSVARTKDTANQLSSANSSTADPSVGTIAVGGAAYDASPHDYEADSTFGASAVFRANCVKCHSDGLQSYQTSAVKFGTHLTRARRLLAAFGVPIADPPSEERVCFACHSVTGDGLKATADEDWYAATAMSAASQALYGYFSPTAAWRTTSTDYLYFKPASEVSVSGNQPSGDLSGDTYAGGTWTARAMTPGASAVAYESYDTANAAVTAGTQTWRRTRFVSPSVASTTTVSAGTWTISVYDRESSANANGFIRYYVYVWGANNAWKATIAAAGSGGTEMGTTALPGAAQAVSVSGSSVTLAPGDKVVLDLAIRTTTVTTAGSYALTYSWGSGASGYLRAPASIAYAVPSGDAHDVVAYAGKHRSDETTSWISSNKHVECEDCHNVHAARAGTHTSGTNAASGVLAGATGVAFTSGTTNWSTTGTSLTWTNGVSKEYETCLKCHSRANTSLSSRDAAWTDVALEFNTANLSYHPVFGPISAGRTIPAVNAAYMKAPWNANLNTLTMYCSDCHADSAASPAAQGPHGSAVPHLLKGTWTGAETLGGTLPTLCTRCHAVTGTNLAHTRGAHSGYPCTACHILVPHGGKMPRLLTAPTAPARYLASPQLRSCDYPITSQGNCSTTGCAHGTGILTYTW